MTFDPCPAAHDIDGAWLAAALGVPGAGVSITQASIGTGQVGENVRYHLSWDDDQPTLPTSVVGKFPSLDPESRAIGIATGSYQHEVGFYRDAQSIVDTRTPAMYHVGASDDASNFVLLMEDISNAAQGDQIAGGTVAQAHLAAREVAKLHGPTVNHPALAGLTWTEAPSDSSADDRAALYNMLLPGFLDRYAQRLGADVLDMGRWLGSHNRKRMAGSQAPLSLIHGDYRLDNMLFGADGTLVVVDWQTASIGSGPADLAYFVGAGLLPATRQTAEVEIFSTYCNVLEGYTDIDRDVLWHDYVLGTASGYAMAVIASQLVGQTERGDEMFAVMAERHAAQMADLGLADLLG